VAALSVYSLMLLVAAFPAALPPFRPLFVVKLASGYLLHLVGITPGLEVFAGTTVPRAVQRMTCLRIVGEGTSRVVLYDDLATCRERRIAPIRDPFRMFQMRNLSEAFVHLNLGGSRDLARDPLRALFLFADYYCHVPEAQRAGVRSVSIESLYVGMSLDDGSTGVVKSGGRHRCDRPQWEIRK
jgi:hypothetical protein